ncbi:uncharacterized protein AB675_288 [Cyphellophora attinorum]|uniref:Uncharacterized protein n=1 Tax=Cyphellophora attinorum TaxID=1664694 RepID=A0A0N0NS26_9EURO|nr:uncharacterized protein AB675_288 [Phialophora attinorum]KPI45768.1 hypothetical protein AB675_288 [Phialophora attinorum]
MAPTRHVYDLVDNTAQHPSPIWEDSSSRPTRAGRSVNPDSRHEKSGALLTYQNELGEPQQGQYGPRPVIEDRARSRPSSRRVFGWFYETSSILVAAASFAGMVALLRATDDKPLPDWPSEITVNAILSVLVTILKGALAITVTECLSQLKWSWFRQERRLVDLITFDEASRSAWGAARLLCSIRSWYLAYFGAFMLTISVILGPTVQQTIEVRVRLVEATSENATMPICNTSMFSMMSFGGGAGMNKVNLPVMGAMYDGLMQTSAQSPIDPGCPSGNCTFPRYQSLGVVARCEDRSSELVLTKRGFTETNDTTYNTTMTPRECADQVPLCHAEWPRSGLFLIPYGTINSTVNYTLRASDFAERPREDPPLYVWHGITGPGQRPQEPEVPPPVAVECEIHFAVYTYESTMSSGKLSESIVSTTSAGATLNGTGQWDFQNYLSLTADPCYANGTEINSADHPDLCTYSVYSAQGLSISNTLDPILTGYGYRTASNRPGFEGTGADVLQALSGLSDGASLSDPKVGSFEYVDRAFQSLAAALTNHARGSDAVCGGATILGTQWREEVYLHARWAWLVPTAVLFVLCVVFFLAVTVKFRGEELWKSSPLAFLVARVRVDGRELGPEELRKLGGAEAGADKRSVEKMAKEINASLGPVR